MHDTKEQVELLLYLGYTGNEVTWEVDGSRGYWYYHEYNSNYFSSSTAYCCEVSYHKI